MTNNNIFLGSGTSVTFVPEVDLYIESNSNTIDNTVAGFSTVTIDTNFTDRFRLVENLYVGCIIEYYDNATFTSRHRVTSNTHNTITFSNQIQGTIDATGSTPADFFRLKRYGAPCPAPKTGSIARLNADNWLGIVESLTFPENEVETKQQNLFVGGSRNYTYQYKGIETAGAADIGVVANHAAWLYYFFGKVTDINEGLAANGSTITYSADSAGSPAHYIASSTNSFIVEVTPEHSGPFYYRTLTEGGTANIIVPPVVRGHDSETDMKVITAPALHTDGSIINAITYTFGEEDGDNLPSFALEQSFSKLPSSNPYRTNTADADEDTNFVRIARGLRVNTLTLTANENEELKINMNAMCRNIHTLGKTEAYEARRGVEDETSFVNYSSTDSFREPFFFSDGTINMFGQELLKITNFTLTMNNTLTDKRFVGMGSRKVKDAIPAQRTYEMTFSALVTDDKLYNELLNTSETTGSNITLSFTKGNGEAINLAFDNYFLTSNSWPMPEDKGPVTVEGTIMARSIGTCTAKTHWILQG